MERHDHGPVEEYGLCGEVYAGTSGQEDYDSLKRLLRLKNLAYLCIYDPAGRHKDLWARSREEAKKK